MSRGDSHQDVTPREELERLERAPVGPEEALAALDEALLVPHLAGGDMRLNRGRLYNGEGKGMASASLVETTHSVKIGEKH